MKIPWVENKCILCLKENTLCDEHIIPKSIGGRLICCFLCLDCNSELGHEIDAYAKSDPSILLAANKLNNKIPTLTKKIINDHPHIADSKQGKIQGYIKNNEFIVRSKKLEDGSFIEPTQSAKKSIYKILKKQNQHEILIDKVMSDFDDFPEDKKIEIIPGLEVTKWSIQNLEIDLSKAQLMNLLIPAKIAFEFLACHAQSAFYENVKQLDQIRTPFKNRKLNPSSISVERLTSNKYEPFHGICFEENSPHAKVIVRLFGWLAFRIHFLQLSVSGPRFVYTHKLDTNEEYIDEIK